MRLPALLAPASLLLLAPAAPAQIVDDWRLDVGPPPAFVAGDSTGHVYAISGGFDVYRIAPDGTLLWSRRHDVGAPNNQEFSFQCVVDSADAVIVTGYSEGTGEFMTVKWDTQGVMQWAHLYREGFRDEAFKIGIDAADNVYVTGHSLNAVTFTLDFLTISLDPGGNLRWARRLDLGGYEQPTALAVRPDGRNAITGHEGNSTVLTVSYDANGTELWHNTLYPVLIPGNAVGIASDGAVYVAGVSLSAGHVICYGPTGTLEWEFERNRPGFPIWSNFRKLAVDSHDRAVVCGQADGLGGYTDWSAVCVDRQGALVWEDYVNGFESNDEWAEAIVIGADDAVYAGGKICNNSTSSWMHGLVVKWDRHGVRQWEHHYEGIGGGTITRDVLALDNVERVLAGTSHVTRASDASKLQLRVQDLAAGGTALISVANAAAQERIHFVFSLTGAGDGPCPPALGGLCLDLLAPVQLAGSTKADARGVAILKTPVPPKALGRSVFLQAVAARGGAGSLSSNLVATVVR